MLPLLVETAFGAVATVWIAAYQPTQSRQYDVIIDEKFDAADAVEITHSLDAWLAVVPELRLYTRPGYACDPRDGDAPAHVHPLICIVLVEPSGLPDNTLGLTIPESQGAVVALPAGTTQDAIAHEIGHAMGLPHLRKCGTLMYPARYHNGKRCDAMVPTSRDVRAWHAISR